MQLCTQISHKKEVPICSPSTSTFVCFGQSEHSFWLKPANIIDVAAPFPA